MEVNFKVDKDFIRVAIDNDIIIDGHFCEDIVVLNISLDVKSVRDMYELGKIFTFFAGVEGSSIDKLEGMYYVITFPKDYLK